MSLPDLLSEKEEKEERKAMSKRKKRALAAIALLAAAGVGVAGIYGATELYDSFFKRYPLPDYPITPGEVNYDMVKDELPRQEISFYSDSIRLQGYFYAAGSGKRLVVLSHGMHAGADDYLPIVRFFVQNGYHVFAYDDKGTYRSDGDSTVGMCEGLVDLDHALDFLNTDARFSGMKLFLVGHSWGGYASASVLSLHPEVSACACIAPFNSGYTLITEKGEQYVGELSRAGLSEPFLKVYQRILFKDYVDFSGVKGINSTDIPVLIAHGRNDRIIGFQHQAIIAHQSEITNPNVQYVITEGLQGGHDSLWHSAEAVRYQQDVENQLKQLKKGKDEDLTREELIAFYAGLDHRLYSEINEDLFKKILVMFNSVE